MTKNSYDLAVIGAGPGGYVAAIRAAQLGLKTVCIEKESSLGGTCLNVGCIPSKALLQSTEHYDFLQKFSGVHGIDCEGLSFKLPVMMERKSQIVKGLVDGIAALFKKNGVTHIHGAASFTSQNTIEIKNSTGTESITADKFILATGSEPIALPFLPFDEKSIVSSTGALSLNDVPKKLVVVGAGVIGVELASVYKRLGADVTVVEMLDQICVAMDGAVSKSLLQVLKKQGITFLLGAKVVEAKLNASSASIFVEHENSKKELIADLILVAVGRRPYTKGLNLQTIGVDISAKGFVTVDAGFRTSMPNIYAIGDVIEGPMLAHRASEEGYALAEILAGHACHINYISIPNVIYTHPEAAAVGLTEEEARRYGLPLSIGICYFKGNPRARCSGDTEGFVKVIGDKSSGRLVGMHMIGSHVSEMIGEGVIALDKGATLQDIADASHAHPTLSEAIKEACLNALSRAVH